jgi:hypothetical protein
MAWLEFMANAFVFLARAAGLIGAERLSRSLIRAAGNSLHKRIEKLNNAYRYGEASAIAEHTLELIEQTFGAEHLEVARPITDLAGVRFGQARYVEAGPLLERALQVRERALGSDHPEVAQALSNLAGCRAMQDDRARRKNCIPAPSLSERRLSALPIWMWPLRFLT